ncbi:unnamed protein product [Boreogadus saida]
MCTPSQLPDITCLPDTRALGCIPKVDSASPGFSSPDIDPTVQTRRIDEQIRATVQASDSGCLIGSYTGRALETALDYQEEV